MRQTAQNLASQGRYGDTMLVHMSPQEVGGLQVMARNHGTSLTVNPQTGLPEAFSLKSLLPMIAGAGLTAVSGGALSPLTIGLMTGGIGALATGSIKEGLMMGLGAAGGAGLAGSAAGLAGAPAVGPQTVVDPTGFASAVPPMPDASAALAAPEVAALPELGASNAIDLNNIVPDDLTGLASNQNAVADVGNEGDYLGRFAPGQTFTPSAPPASGFSRFSQGAGKAFESPEALGKFLGGNKMNLAMAAAPGLIPEEPDSPLKRDSYIRPYSLDIANLSNAPISPEGIEQERLRYRYIPGTPYRAAQGGIVAFARGGNTPDGQEIDQNPTLPPQPKMQLPPLGRLDSYAEGGQAKYRDVRKKIDPMEDPYKFADYRSSRGLSESAKSNFAGGGLSGVPRFLSGGGDGMSDSIPATINDRQPARLADGEFVIPADVVSHLGNGSSKAGAKQLYAMMDRVRRQRTGKKRQAPAVNPKRAMPA